MNPVFNAARDAHELGWLGTSMTVLFFLFFAGWVVWTYRPSAKAQLEALGRIPLDDEPSRGGEA